MPVERLPEFLAWFDARGRDAAGVAVPGASRPAAWPPYPLEPGRTYVNVGFWGTVHVGPDAADAPLNRAIEDKVPELGGHKSLYSEAFYDRDDLRPALRRRQPRAGEGALRPRRPADQPLRQGGATTMTMTQIGDRHRVRSLLRDGMPVRFTAYDGSAAGPPDADITLELLNERGLAYLLTAPGDLGMARAYVAGDLVMDGVHPGDPYDALVAAENDLRFRPPTPAEALRSSAAWASATCARRPRRRGGAAALAAGDGGPAALHGRDAEAIPHHYDVSNAFYELVLGPSMTYTCAVFPTPTRRWRRRSPRSTTWSPASSTSSPASGCSTSAAAGAGWSGTPRASTA